MSELTYTINVHDGLVTFASKVIVYLRSFINDYKHVTVTAHGAKGLNIEIEFDNGYVVKLYIEKESHWKQELETRFEKKESPAPSQHLWGIPIVETDEPIVDFDDKGLPITINVPMRIRFKRK